MTETQVTGTVHEGVESLDSHPFLVGINCPAGRLSFASLRMDPRAMFTLGRVRGGVSMLHGGEGWGCEFHFHEDGSDEQRHFFPNEFDGKRGSPFYLAVADVSRVCVTSSSGSQSCAGLGERVEGEEPSIAELAAAAKTKLPEAEAILEVTADLEVDAVGYQHLFEELDIVFERRPAHSIAEKVTARMLARGRSALENEPLGVSAGVSGNSTSRPGRALAWYSWDSWDTPEFFKEYSVVNFNWNAREWQPQNTWTSLVGSLVYCKRCYAYIGASVLIKTKWSWATLQTATFKLQGAALFNLDIDLDNIDYARSASLSGRRLVPSPSSPKDVAPVTTIRIPLSTFTITIDVGFRFSYDALVSAKARVRGAGPAVSSNNVIAFGTTYNRANGGWKQIKERQLDFSTRRPWLDLSGTVVAVANFHATVQLSLFSVWPVEATITATTQARFSMGYDSSCSSQFEAELEMYGSATLSGEVGNIDYSLNLGFYSYDVELPGLPVGFQPLTLMSATRFQGSGLSGCVQAKSQSSSAWSRRLALPSAGPELKPTSTADEAAAGLGAAGLGVELEDPVHAARMLFHQGRAEGILVREASRRRLRCWSGRHSASDRCHELHRQLRSLPRQLAGDNNSTHTNATSSAGAGNSSSTPGDAPDLSLSQWEAGPWAPCSSDCGAGSQSRFVACQHPDLGVVDEGNCAHQMQPVGMQACRVECRGLTPEGTPLAAIRLPTESISIAPRNQGGAWGLQLFVAAVHLDEDDNGLSLMLEPQAAEAAASSGATTQADILATTFRPGKCPVVVPDAASTTNMWTDAALGTEAILLTASEMGLRHGDTVTTAILLRGSPAVSMVLRSRPFKELVPGFPTAVAIPVSRRDSAVDDATWNRTIGSHVASAVDCTSAGLLGGSSEPTTAFEAYATSNCGESWAANGLPLVGLALCNGHVESWWHDVDELATAVQDNWPLSPISSTGDGNASLPWPQRVAGKPNERSFVFRPREGAVGAVIDAMLQTADPNAAVSLRVGSISETGAWPSDSATDASPDLAPIGLSSFATVVVAGTDFVPGTALGVMASTPPGSPAYRLEVHATEIWRLIPGKEQVSTIPIGGTVYFELELPPTATFVRIELESLEGDADLFVRPNTPFRNRMSWDACNRAAGILIGRGVPGFEATNIAFQGLPESLQSYNYRPLDVVELTPTSGTMAPRYYIAVTAWVRSQFRIVAQAVEQLDVGVPVSRQVLPLQTSFFTGPPPSSNPEDETNLYADQRVRVPPGQPAGVTLNSGAENMFYPTVMEGFAGLSVAPVAPGFRAEAVSEYLASTSVARRMVLGVHGEFHDKTSVPSEPRLFPVTDLPADYDFRVASDVAPARRALGEDELEREDSGGDAHAGPLPTVQDALRRRSQELLPSGTPDSDNSEANDSDRAEARQGERRAAATNCRGKLGGLALSGVVERCERGVIRHGDPRLAPASLIHPPAGRSNTSEPPVRPQSRRALLRRPLTRARGAGGLAEKVPETANLDPQVLFSTAGSHDGLARTILAPHSEHSPVVAILAAAGAMSHGRQRAAAHESGGIRVRRRRLSGAVAPAQVAMGVASFQFGEWVQRATCSAEFGVLTASACTTLTGPGDESTFLRVDIPARTRTHVSIVSSQQQEPRDAAYLIRAKAGQLPTPDDFDDEALSTGRTTAFLNCEFEPRQAFLSVSANNAGSIKFDIIVAAEDASNCPEFVWVPGPWGDWSHSCEQATRTRDVRCTESATGRVVAPTFCSPAVGMKPAASEEANLGACVWVVSRWSACTKQCGGGQQFRTTDCLNGGGRGAKVLDAHCGEAPLQTRGCNMEHCRPEFWDPGPWRACSRRCGGGFRTRAVSCRQAVQGAPDVSVVADSDEACSEALAGPKPHSREACGTAACDESTFELVLQDFRVLQEAQAWTERALPADSMAFFLWEASAATKGVCIEASHVSPLREDSGVCSVTEQGRAADCLEAATNCMDAAANLSVSMTCFESGAACLGAIPCRIGNGDVGAPRAQDDEVPLAENAVSDAFAALRVLCADAHKVDGRASSPVATCYYLARDAAPGTSGDAVPGELDLFAAPVSPSMEAALSASVTETVPLPIPGAFSVESDSRRGRGFTPPSSSRTSLWSSASSMKTGTQHLWLWADEEPEFDKAGRLLIGVRALNRERRVTIRTAQLSSFPATFSGTLANQAVIKANQIRDGGLVLQVDLTCDTFVPPVELLQAQRQRSAAVDEAAALVLGGDLGNSTELSRSAYFRMDLIATGLTADQSSALGWNRVAKPTLMQAQAPFTRLSFANKRLTITLPPIPGYRPSGDEQLRLTIPGSLLSSGRLMAVPGESWRVTVEAEDSDCKVSEWSAWTYCSGICRLGLQTRTRTVTRTAVGRGASCPATVQTRRCNTCNKCITTDCFNGGLCVGGECTCRPGFTGLDCSGPPASSDVFFWKAGPWSNCTSACGGGKQGRTTTCMRARATDGVSEVDPSQCNEASAPPSERDCNDHVCSQPSALISMHLATDSAAVSESADQLEAFSAGVISEISAAVGISPQRLRVNRAEPGEQTTSTLRSLAESRNVGKFRSGVLLSLHIAPAPLFESYGRHTQQAEIPVEAAIASLQTQVESSTSTLRTQGSLASQVSDLEFVVVQGVNNAIVSTGKAVAPDVAQESPVPLPSQAPQPSQTPAAAAAAAASASPSANASGGRLDDSPGEQSLPGSADHSAQTTPLVVGLAVAAGCLLLVACALAVALVRARTRSATSKSVLAPAGTPSGPALALSGAAVSHVPNPVSVQARRAAARDAAGISDGGRLAAPPAAAPERSDAVPPGSG